jgi:preprotein translocase subunit SecD
MHRVLTLTVCALVLLFVGELQAQAQFSIRAASDQPVAGWDRMEFNNNAVWVSPTASLTSADIMRAEPGRGPDGRMAVNVILTDGGAKKMRDLSTAQLNKLVAMVLDGNVIFAPRVRSEIGKEVMVTGNDPSGLSPTLIDRIVAGVNRK